jgi:type IV pilus assembly protein PilX
MEQTMSIPNQQRMRPASMRTRPSRQAQRGAVLVVALIFLILLTILAISASGRSLLQERMAGGLRNAQQAEMSAQTALRGAEWKLWTSTIHAITTGGGGINCGTGIFTDCYVYNAASPVTDVTNFRTKPGWVTAGATEYKGYANGQDYTAFASGNQVGNLAKNPWYLIEDLGPELPPGVSGTLCESGATGFCSGGPTSGRADIYRITARGAGASANTVRVLESTFAAIKSGN